MEINSYYQIGKDHKVCEDYAISGTDPFPFVIVTDGCSSNQHTDIGSRIIASMTKKNLEYFHPESYMDFLKKVIFQSKTVATIMGLDKDCLYSTLLLIVKFDEVVYALMVGDGCIIYKENDEIKSIVHEYKDNYPYYPIYINSDIDTTNKGLVVKENISKQDLPFDTINLYTFNSNNLDWILCSSDGLFSFTNGSELLNFSVLVEQVSDLKSFTGEFLERKMKRITKNMSKNGFYNSDDWSLGGIYLGGNNESIC